MDFVDHGYMAAMDLAVIQTAAWYWERSDQVQALRRYWTAWGKRRCPSQWRVRLDGLAWSVLAAAAVLVAEAQAVPEVGAAAVPAAEAVAVPEAEAAAVPVAVLV